MRQPDRDLTGRGEGQAAARAPSLSAAGLPPTSWTGACRQSQQDRLRTLPFTIAATALFGHPPGSVCN